MSELEKIRAELLGKTGLALDFYRENTKPTGVAVCDTPFEQVTDDGENTFFRFLYKNVGYIGVIKGAGKTERNYALLLPSFVESYFEKETDLTKAEFLKRLLRGECPSAVIYKYAAKYSLRESSCFVLALRVPRLKSEAIALMAQYGGNSLDTVVEMDGDECVLVRFVGDEEDEYRSAVDYAEFLAQSLKEELGLDVTVGVGATVRNVKDVGSSYAQATSALRYAEVFKSKGNVHCYREYLLVKMLEDVSESRLAEYLAELTNENAKEIFSDEEMVNTAEEFLQNSLNVSETSRNLYMHRNTLLYRLDKIEKATGLNIRLFPDAVSFRVLTVLYKLLGK